MFDPSNGDLTDDLPLHLPPEALKQLIRALVRRYIHRRSPGLARAIVRCGEALSLHPALRDRPDELNAFCRLTWHWRMLADLRRGIIEGCNGELIRHDGGLEDSRKRHGPLLASADAVICPADCVSHDAYRRTKRFRKRFNKPCVLIERSGIGAFAAALSLLAPAGNSEPGPTALGDPARQPA